jgi:UDP-glucose 4-epimerase
MQAAKDVEGIFHMAEHSGGAASARDPAGGTLSLEQNVLGTAVILEAAHKMRVHKVLLASSAAVYGDHQQAVAEDTALVGLTPYAVSKQMAERILEMYDALYDVRTVSLRLFNVYGPRQPANAPYAGVVAKFLELASQGKPMTIEGQGDQVRDFIHVKDAARAFILAFDANARGEHINVGSGMPVTIKGLAEMVSSSKAHLPRRAHDSSVVVSDTCKAKRVLHFHAEHNLANDIKEFKTDPLLLSAVAPFWRQPETIDHMNHQIMERVDGQLFVWSNMTMEARSRQLRKAMSRESKFLRHVFMAIKEKRHEEL